MPKKRKASKNRDAGRRAQAGASRDFVLAEPPSESRALELWMQNGAGFILFQRVRAAGLASLGPDASDDMREAVARAVHATMYALMMQIDGVSGGLSSNKAELTLEFSVRLTRANAEVVDLDLRDGDGMCMGFHAWTDGDFGTQAIVAG